MATKSLLTRNQISENSHEYVLFNPSIADFVLNAYSNEIDLICNIVKSLDTIVSIDYLKSLLLSKKIDEKYLNLILGNLFEYFFESKLEEEDWDFLIALSYIDFYNEKINDKIEIFLNALVNADNPSGEKLDELLMILSDFEPKIELNNFDFLYGFINDVDDEYSLQRLLNFVAENEIEDENILMQIDILIDRHLRSQIDDNLQIDFNKHITHTYYHFEGYPETEIDNDGIKSEIQDNIDTFLDGFNVNILEKISFNSYDFVSSIDVDSMVTRFLESYEPDYSGSYEGYISNSSAGDDIDAIFER